MLQMSSREEREYTGTAVRDLATQASRQPGQAAHVLADGLRDGRRKVRSAAAQLLSRLGPDGAPGLARLVQRLFERNPLVRDHVAPALARLLPALHPDMQRWLCLIANPLLPAPANLRAVLGAAGLPAGVRAALAAVCARRIAWWDHIAAGGTGPASAPDTTGCTAELPALTAAVDRVLARAAGHAGRHTSGTAKRAEEEAGQAREAAWLLARVTELIQAALPPAPAPAATAARRTRRK
jgi:hypothetical protein